MNLQISAATSASFEDIIQKLGAVSKNLPKELEIVVSKTAKRTRSIIAKEVVSHYNTTQKKVRSAMRAARPGKYTRIISYMALSQWAAKHVKPKHTGMGVIAKPLKNGAAAEFPGGFMGGKPGKKAAKLQGHAFRRAGKSRLPIKKLLVASPGQIAKTPAVTTPTTKQINDEFRKQITERLRYKSLVASGKITGRDL